MNFAKIFQNSKILDFFFISQAFNESWMYAETTDHVVSRDGINREFPVKS